MKNFLLLLALLTTLLLPAQVIDLDDATTRAVVIGISDYQDDKIPDLRFADRDAQAFAEFLRSKSGGSLTEDQLKLLTNEKATAGQIYMALDGLLTDSKEGDLAIIYFSGHGDAEVKLLNQPGFLLTYESVAQIPKVTCLRLNDLDNYIATLSLGNKARVLVVTDACRSGKLAGREGGAKMANTELAAMSEKAVKIMSCQPDELSYEGEQWGGGRGAFSYFLVNGLYGLADADTSRQVTLTEIGRYLEDNVSREVSPSSQIPKVMGNPKEKVAVVFPDELAKIRESLDPLTVRFKPIDQRGIEDETLARVDSATRAAYRQFKEAVAAKQFFEPADACADTLYDMLTQVAALQPLHNTMKRNYAAALMDDAQEAMNGWLRSDPKEVMSWGSNRKYDYLRFPSQLARAAELLGKSHYLYNDLKAKEYFFRARIHIVENKGGQSQWDSSLCETLHNIVKEGLKYDSEAPYLYAKLAYYYAYKGDYQSESEWYEKAIELAPSWMWAYEHLILSYSEIGKFDKAKRLLIQALKLDSTNISASSIYCRDHQFDKVKRLAAKDVASIESQKVYDEMLFAKANLFWSSGYLDKAEIAFKEAIQQVLASGDTQSIKGLGGGYGFYYGQLGCVKMVQGDWEEAEKWWLKMDSLDGNQTAYGWRSWIAFAKGQKEEADRLLDEHFKEQSKTISAEGIINDVLFLSAIYDLFDYSIFWLEKTREYFPAHAPLHYHLARLHLEQKNDYKTGVPLLEKAVQLDSTHAYAHYHLAAAYAHLGKKQAALNFLKKALEKGYEDFEQMEKEARWERLRGTKRYKELVKKYPPGK